MLLELDRMSSSQSNLALINLAKHTVELWMLVNYDTSRSTYCITHAGSPPGHQMDPYRSITLRIGLYTQIYCLPTLRLHAQVTVSYIQFPTHSQTQCFGMRCFQFIQPPLVCWLVRCTQVRHIYFNGVESRV